MTIKTALRNARQAARANLLPGLLLQALMLVFLVAYETHDGTQRFLAAAADLKESSGYGFAFVSYVISAALLPEILRVGFFQGGRVYRGNWWNVLTAAPAWGAIGVLVDFFYRCQSAWFGNGNDWGTILVKMAVDQLIYSPFVGTPLTIGYFLWRDSGFRMSGIRHIFHRNFFPHRVLPVQIAGWCIWVPGVCLVYFMPPMLQLPVAVLIQTFWVLVFTLVNKPPASEQIPVP